WRLLLLRHLLWTKAKRTSCRSGRAFRQSKPTWPKRARIVLLAADGLANMRIAELTDGSVVAVVKWQACYGESGPAGLGCQRSVGTAHRRPRELPTGGQ